MSKTKTTFVPFPRAGKPDENKDDGPEPLNSNTIKPMDVMGKAILHTERRKLEARQYVISPLASDGDEAVVWIVNENSRRRGVIST